MIGGKRTINGGRGVCMVFGHIANYGIAAGYIGDDTMYHVLYL